MRAGTVARNRNGQRRRGTATLTVDFDGEISIAETLTRLYRETDRNLGATVEHLKDMIAEQTAEFAFDAFLGSQFDPAITGIAFRTSEVGLSHVRHRTMFHHGLRSRSR